MDTHKIDQIIEDETGLDPNSNSLKGVKLYIEIERLQMLLYKAYLRGKVSSKES